MELNELINLLKNNPLLNPPEGPKFIDTFILKNRGQSIPYQDGKIII